MRLVSALIVGALLAICYVIFSAIFIEKSKAAEPRIEYSKEQSKCSHLYEPGNTNPNSPWKRCMGVGTK
jgi:hypothetical protein